ncbi:hypothetical protein [Cellulomonas cellasea]|uniref:DUF3592 domain-containing protein n=1 Tax=Cellulomonas cellasea TaxID=43670 RepID=A0A7W4UF22_9CELL|nr:hypothetical protein [Cellulomonas cellasea]MBB2923022.1 hypothetical protein [Cellulomonas cellasea]
MVEHVALRPRRPRRLRRWAAVVATHLVALVCGAGLVLAAVAAAVLVSEVGPHRDAVALREHGEEARGVTTGEGCTVAFTARGRWVEAEPGCDEPDGDPEQVTVRFLPEDPQVVMLSEDVAYYADEAIPGGLTALGVGLAPSVLTVLAWVVSGRPRWWRHLREPSLPNPFDIAALDL